LQTLEDVVNVAHIVHAISSLQIFPLLPVRKAFDEIPETLLLLTNANEVCISNLTI
jgi:hypothetical protein